MGTRTVEVLGAGVRRIDDEVDDVEARADAFANLLVFGWGSEREAREGGETEGKRGRVGKRLCYDPASLLQTIVESSSGGRGCDDPFEDHYLHPILRRPVI